MIDETLLVSGICTCACIVQFEGELTVTKYMFALTINGQKFFVQS